MKRRAFTIIELLVVLVVISLLLGIVAIQISSIQKSSRDADRLSDVLLIGKAVDQYASTNRGVYPKNKDAAGDSRIMCANELNIDASQFIKKTIPSDPYAVTSVTTGCTNMLNGYTYYSRYGTGATTNIAKQLQAQYVLEVGLETTKARDESNFKGQTDINGISRISESQRQRYFLIGPFCGTTTCDK